MPMTDCPPEGGTSLAPTAAEAAGPSDRATQRADVALDLDHVTVAYGDVVVLRDLSLRVLHGQVVGLIGSSGAGKSTLLRAVHRLVEPRQGRVLIGAEDILRARGSELRALRRRVGFVFQDHALVDRLTVMENVLAGALGRVGLWTAITRRFADDDVQAAYRILADVGLSEFGHRRCDTLSGGQRQRVGIARALFQRPQLLLVDEPTASLDPATADTVMALLTTLCRDEGLSAVINLHDVPIARRFCDRIVGLRDGRITFDGAPDTLTDRDASLIYGVRTSDEGLPAPLSGTDGAT